MRIKNLSHLLLLGSPKALQLRVLVSHHCSYSPLEPSTSLHHLLWHKAPASPDGGCAISSWKL